MKPEQPGPQQGRLSFADWSAALRANATLTPALREKPIYRQRLAAFQRFCQKRAAGPQVALARQYVELARLQEWVICDLRLTIDDLRARPCSS